MDIITYYLFVWYFIDSWVYLLSILFIICLIFSFLVCSWTLMPMPNCFAFFNDCLFGVYTVNRSTHFTGGGGRTLLNKKKLKHCFILLNLFYLLFIWIMFINYYMYLFIYYLFHFLFYLTYLLKYFFPSSFDPA